MPKKTAKTTSRVRQTVKEASANGAAFDVTIPERRATNFFVRLKKSNVAWAKSQAKAKGLNHSEYIDLVIEGLRKQRETHA